MKSFTPKIIRTVLTSLILTLFVAMPTSTQVASAAGTVTKTINVRGANNSLLPNALVAVGYEDPNAANGYWTWTTPVTTNSQGQAVITGLPQDSNIFTELYIEPEVSDTANAILYRNVDPEYGGFTLQSTETLNITLPPAAVRVNLVDTMGSDAPVYSRIEFPNVSGYNRNYSAFNILRTGAFGLAFSPDATCDIKSNRWGVYVGPLQTNESSVAVARTTYNLSMPDCTSRALKVVGQFNDTETAKVSNVYQLAFAKRLFNYAIVSPEVDRARLTDAWLEICSGTGNAERCDWGGPDAAGLGLPDGTYRISVNPGSSGFAQSSYSLVVGSNGASVSLKVGFPASGVDVPTFNGRRIFAAGLPNVSGDITKPNGETITLINNQGFSLTLLKADENNNYEWVSNSWSNGKYGFNISEPGLYKVEVYPAGFSEYTVTRSPVITVTDTGTVYVSWNGGAKASKIVQNIALAVPNVKMIIKNPITQETLTSGGATFEKYRNPSGDLNDREWAAGAWIDYQNPGQVGANLADGTYRVRIEPPQGQEAISGLANKIYTVVVASSGTSITFYSGPTATGAPLTAVGGKYILYPSQANITGRYLDANGQPVGQGMNVWVDACLQKQNLNKGFWENVECTNTNSNGVFSISATEAGLYRVYLDPHGRSDLARTTLPSFEFTSGNLDTPHAYGDVTSAAPTLKVRVVEDGSSRALTYMQVQVLKDGVYQSDANTMGTGEVGIKLPSAGTYEFVLYPNDRTPNSTRKSYEVIATESNGTISATVTGATAANGVTTLALGAAQLRGFVYKPGTNEPVANAYVVAVKKSTGEEMGQFGSNSRSDGSFAMSLPAGTYTLYAHAPWRSILYGDSAPLGDVTVASNLTASLSGADFTGMTTSSIVIRLANPYWTGTIRTPDSSTVVTNSRVCLNVQIGITNSGRCSETDLLGRWAMAAPAGFTDFGSNDQLQVMENFSGLYSSVTYQGKTAIEAAGMNHSGGQNIGLKLAEPNFTVRIVYGESSTPVANAWVNLNAVNTKWLGGAQTNATGYARFNVDLTKNYSIQAQIDISNTNSTITGQYASTNKTYSNSDVTAKTSASKFTDTITLAVPNIRGVLIDTSTNNEASPWSWVELFAIDGRWIAGANTDRNGYLAINAPASASYTLKVNPSWNSQTIATSHIYNATINGSGVLTSFRDSLDNAVVDTVTYNQNPVLNLKLSPPSVAGQVKSTAGIGLQNSWIIPTNTVGNVQLWQSGTNSRLGGNFSLGLPDGSYQLTANVPWGEALSAPSAPCAITILGKQITTSVGGCVKSGPRVELQLRSPNFSVTVTDASGNPLANANVGLGLGNWNVNAQTNSDGIASLFIDPVVIANTNAGNKGPTSGLQNLWMWIDPPWGNTSVVRTNCSSLQAGSACATLPQVNLSSATFATSSMTARLPAPNTSVTIRTPGAGTTSVGNGSWVSIESFVKDGSGNIIGRNWVGGAVTNDEGVAVFNITDTSTMFSVRVEAPWSARELYAATLYDGDTHTGIAWSAINGQVFRVATPNLTMAIRSTDSSTVAPNGWIAIENVNGSNQPTGWVGGYGLNQEGTVSAKLASSGRFRITAYPGPGVVGVQTVCIVTTNGGGTVSLVGGQCGAGTLSGATVTLPLATGNIYGTVTDTSTPAVAVVGAIVTANHAGSSDTSTLVVTSTDKLGYYSMQLDPGYTWTITVTPVNTPSDPVRLAARTLTSVQPPNTGQQANSTTLSQA